MSTLVYLFEEGNRSMKGLLGGKGANLAEMTQLGLPVPPGFTITTSACNLYFKEEEKMSSDLVRQIKAAMLKLEEKMNRKFDDLETPLLVSVRSGSVFSMPGMMDTILNLGLSDRSVESLAKQLNDQRFAYDCYRRLIQMFGEVVKEIPKSYFENALEKLKIEKNAKNDTDLTAEHLIELTETFKHIYQQHTKETFPQQAEQQLLLAVEAVFKSWHNPRAKIYRDLHQISESLGTAVNIQGMVFGNAGETSGTGVAFTRNPATGEKQLFGEFLLNAQGEDVVAGIRTPEPIADLKAKMPSAYQQFEQLAEQLEKHYQDVQDIEFTIENGKLYLLQTRNGKRTAQAAIQIVVDMVNEGLMTKKEAILRIDAPLISKLLHPIFDEVNEKKTPLIATGLPASPGAASGKVYFDAISAKAAAEQGEKVILVRSETSPEDIEGMIVSEAIVTSRGGMTSHAAVVARGMGTCCVAGCGQLIVHEQEKIIFYDQGEIHEGEVISVDGGTGKLYLGEIPTQVAGENPAFKEFLQWLPAFSDLKVRANADTPRDIQTALAFGASGIGLVRTEHMFFEGKRLFNMRKLILAKDFMERKGPLANLLKIQTQDFEAIFRATKDHAVTIRLLDPPLHEFLPKTEAEIVTVAGQMGLRTDQFVARIGELEEVNPMLGHRGCRLAITYPEIYEMQVEAMIKSAITVGKEGHQITPEIMVPLIGSKKELQAIKASLTKKIEEVLTAMQVKMDYTIGTMIEIPRACVTADQIAEEADFFSFGTNDLTQLTYGFSRDDIAKFVGEYLGKGILPKDPFQSLDIEGVGSLIRIAVEKGRQTNPNLKIGVCGEVGGDPASIAFFREVGLNYVSCSPYRVPIALLACSHATLKA